MYQNVMMNVLYRLGKYDQVLFGHYKMLLNKLYFVNTSEDKQ